MTRRYVPRVKKNRRRSYRRKTYHRKNLVLSKAPIPNKFATKLRYAQSGSVNPGVSGVAGVQVFNASSCYDPDTTGVGHQPRGFDQWMTMFDHFTVIGAKITITFGMAGQTSDRTIVCGVNLKDFSTAESDKNEYMEGRNVRSRMIAGGGNADARTTSLSLTYSPKKFLSIGKPLSNTSLKGNAASNPSENAYFHCWAAPTNAVDVESIFYQAVIDYLVVFTEPKQPTQS